MRISGSISRERDPGGMQKSWGKKSCHGVVRCEWTKENPAGGPPKQRNQRKEWDREKGGGDKGGKVGPGEGRKKWSATQGHAEDAPVAGFVAKLLMEKTLPIANWTPGGGAKKHPRSGERFWQNAQPTSCHGGRRTAQVRNKVRRGMLAGRLVGPKQVRRCQKEKRRQQGIGCSPKKRRDFAPYVEPGERSRIS